VPEAIVTAPGDDSESELAAATFKLHVAKVPAGKVIVPLTAPPPTQVSTANAEDNVAPPLSVNEPVLDTCEPKYSCTSTTTVPSR
jgi:hypothetical protein